MTLPELQENIAANFETEMLDGLVDTIICYLESTGVTEFTYSEHEHWRVSFRRKA